MDTPDFIKETSNNPFTTVPYHTHNGLDSPELATTATATPFQNISTNFEDITRFLAAVTGSGSNSVSAANGGLLISAGASASSYAQMIWKILQTGNANLLARNPNIFFTVEPRQIDLGSGEGDFYCGLGSPATSGASITYTDSHIGFKILKRSGVLTLYGTCANGTSEQLTTLTTVAQNDALDLWAQITTSGVTYYYSKNGADWVSGTTSGNLPATLNTFSFSVSNRATAFNYNFTIAHASLTR